MGGSSSTSSQPQTSVQQQVANQGDYNTILGAGTTLVIGNVGGSSYASAPTAGTTTPGQPIYSTGVNQTNSVSNRQISTLQGYTAATTTPGTPGGSAGNGGAASGNISVNVTTADVNAIDLASHVADINATVSQAAINAQQAAILGNTAVALDAINSQSQTNAQEVALYQLGLNFANSVTNQTLAILANTVPQTSSAQAEILAGTAPTAGTISPATVTTTTNNGTTTATPGGATTSAGANVTATDQLKTLGIVLGIVASIYILAKHK